VGEVNVVIPAPDGFAEANQNSTTEALIEVVEEVLAEAASTGGLFTTVTVATSFGCPFDAEVDPARMIEVARRSAAAAAKESAIAGTIGVDVPIQVRTLLDGVREVGRLAHHARHQLLHLGADHRWTELLLVARAAIAGSRPDPANPLCAPSARLQAGTPTGPWTRRHRPSSGDPVVPTSHNHHRQRSPSREPITTSKITKDSG
jgi:hypothetical protein